MSSIFKSLMLNKKKYLDDVFIQNETTDTMIQTLNENHQFLKKRKP